ncbi:hypothetical protein [Stenomitos frigidus]|uniref:Apea-like HEPN domain-containing protein n=1 Tax=Stenomitos frigidus ULC18 TaxID=2107698 RepID=A0A2T1E5Z5_9CYAN|nr:hypothetical protein [Stenomitos frigidus]PSB28172.1 hypothetical protein C7B82_15130 [Stenomitos frigidus ULC18]
MILCPISIRIEKFNGQFRFSESTQIREISNSELNQYFGVDAPQFNDDDQITGYTQFQGIDGRQRNTIWTSLPKGLLASQVDEYPPPKYVIESSNDEEIRKMITALHIITRGSFVCPIGIETLSKTEETIHFYPPFNFTFELPCKLSNHDLSKSQELFSRLMKNKQDHGLEILLKRLLRCCDIDQSREIRMIDAVSIIESIVCGNHKTEMTFRFSLNSSFLLNKAGVQVPFSEMKVFYDTRSNLAHGGHDKKLASDSIKWTEAIDKILNYMKVVLKEYIDHDVDGKKIEKELLSKLNIPS